MSELKEFVGDTAEKKSTAKPVKDEKKAEIAGLYEDCYEYEMDLEAFQSELEIIKNHELKVLGEALSRELPNDERNYDAELKAVVEAAWNYRVNELGTHPNEQYKLIQGLEFPIMAEQLTQAFPEHEGDFFKEIKEALVQRWELLIEIKKEHIKEEIADIKTAGLKPHYAKRIYKEYHGITD